MKKLKTFLLTILIGAFTCCMFLFGACGASIAGTYKFESLTYTEGGVSMELKAGEKFMGAITLSEEIMTITLNEDGTATVTEAMEEESETETGTWKKVDEHTIELTIDDETQSLAWNEDTLTLNVDGIKMNLKK